MIPEGVLDADGKQVRFNGAAPVHVEEEHNGQRGSAAAADEPKRKSGVPTVVGTLHVHPDGFGFGPPTETAGENVFLPPQEAKRAIDGDRVEVEVSTGPSGRNIGRIVKVHQRLRQMVVGTSDERGTEAWVTPSDGSLGAIKVPKT